MERRWRTRRTIILQRAKPTTRLKPRKSNRLRCCPALQDFAGIASQEAMVLWTRGGEGPGAFVHSPPKAE